MHGLDLDTETLTQGRHAAPLDEPQFPGLTILCHPDALRVGERIAFPELHGDGTISLSRAEPLFAAPDGRSQPAPLGDAHLSRKPLQISRLKEQAILRRNDSSTRVEIDGEPLVDEARIPLDKLQRGVVLLLSSRIVLLLHLLEPIPSAPSSHGLVGESAAIAKLRRRIDQVGRYAVPVLIRGETGAGKELVAQAIHSAGPLHDKPCISVNMGAIPPALAAAELFGAAKGAFTGAVQKRQGFFEQAHGGTLFLDEIGETPQEVQVLLLRALETGEISPVGGEAAKRVNVRLLAATDADLERAIAEDRFREPLLHRLAGYEIRLPPLRDRIDDLGRLLYHFLREELAKVGESSRLVPENPRAQPWPDARLIARLALFDWPGNVRQLRNMAQRLVVAGHDLKDLEAVVQEALTPPQTSPPQATPPKPAASKPKKAGAATHRPPHEVSDDELIETLRENAWNIKPTAAALGVSRTSLYNMIDRNPLLRRANEIPDEEIEDARRRRGGDLDAAADELKISRHALQQRLRKIADSDT